MLNFSLMTPMARSAKALDFLRDFNCMRMARVTTPLSDTQEISIVSFDLWLIDNDMADDPGTDDPKALAYKGFVQQRNNARTALNRWGRKLAEHSAFAVTVDKNDGDIYHVKPWADNSFELASDIGNRVEKFTKNKVNSVKALHRLAVDKHMLGEDTDELIQMISMLEGHSLVMLREIRGQITKYNRAVELVEQKAQESLLLVEHSG